MLELLWLVARSFYEARGREDGHDLDDWLRGEEEIGEKKVRPGSVPEYSSTFCADRVIRRQRILG